MIVSVIGLGYIGLPTAAVLASNGIKVIGVDVNQNAVDSVNQGKTYIIEPELDILVQTTSRYHTWVQAKKQYNIGTDSGDVVSLRKISDRSIDKPFEKQFKDFLEKSSEKRPSNDKAKKNPETPEG